MQGPLWAFETLLAELRRDFLSISFQGPPLLPELSVLDDVLAPGLPFVGRGREMQLRLSQCDC